MTTSVLFEAGRHRVEKSWKEGETSNTSPNSRYFHPIFLDLRAGSRITRRDPENFSLFLPSTNLSASPRYTERLFLFLPPCLLPGFRITILKILDKPGLPVGDGFALSNSLAASIFPESQRYNRDSPRNRPIVSDTFASSILENFPSILETSSNGSNLFVISSLNVSEIK